MDSVPPQPTFKYLVRFIKPYTVPVVATMLFLLIGQIASSFEPVWLKKIIDGVTAGNTLEQLLVIVAGYFGLRAIDALFAFLRDFVFASTEMNISRSLSRELFHHLLSLPIGYHVDQRVGGTSRKITRGSRAVTFILDFLVINIFPTIAQLIIATIVLLKLYAPVYGLVTFATIVLYTAFTIWATEKRQTYRVAANKADDEVSGLEVDSLNNIETVKYFNSEAELQRRYQPLIDHRFNLSVTSNKLFAAVEGGQAFILLIGLGIILLLGIRQTVAHQLTVGDLVLLTSYIAQLSAPIGVLGFIYRQIKDGLADIQGMAGILQEKITVKEPAHPQRIAKPAGKVTFDKVAFGYGNGREILKGVSLDTKPGSRVAFVGSSGAGKSTIVKLLFRLYDPTGGAIEVDGIDLRELAQDNRRDILAIVPQEPVLFNDTIAANIRFAKPDATDAEIEQACKLASIDTLIKSLPEGYETVVGERGVKLSGGEKQRVAIARSIIRNPKILVFDEATSSLDSNSERDILQALKDVSAGRTTIAVAHRLSTIVDSDVIYVLDKGAVVEQGSHSALLAKGGRYAELWKLQVEGKDEELAQ